MTTPGSDLTAPPTLPSDAHRLVLGDLVGRLARALGESAARYEAAAGWADGPLRQALEALGRATRARCADVASVARAAGLPVPPGGAGPPASAREAWGVILGEAFQAERVLGRLAGELGALAQDPPLRALGMRVAVGAAEQGAEVRRLYLQYS
jgi:hypothetical protein